MIVEMTEIAGIFGTYSMNLAAFTAAVVPVFLWGVGVAIVVTFIPTAFMLAVKALLHMIGRS